MCLSSQNYFNSQTLNVFVGVKKIVFIQPIINSKKLLLSDTVGRCSVEKVLKFRKVHRKTPVPGSLF